MFRMLLRRRSMVVFAVFSAVIIMSAFQAFELPNGSSAVPVSDFVNFESAHVHPLDMTPDGTKLLAVNTANNSLEVFQVNNDVLLNVASIPVGLDPVTVRVRSNTEAWVVNQVSDEISVVDLVQNVVVRSLRTENEPADVVFAGMPQRAFVSCAERESIQVFDLNSLGAPPTEVLLKGEQPRAMAVSPDGNTVYTAFFESGNRTTVINGNTFLAGGACSPQGGCTSVPSDVENPAGPYGGVLPVPNSGAGFQPPLNVNNPPATGAQSLVVRKNDAGQWLDDNNGNWTTIVSGGLAGTARTAGWDMPDRDVAVLNANSLTLSYQPSLGNILMAVGVNPVSGQVSVVGTDAMNHIRFEPNLNGKFLRVNVSQFTAGGSNTITDLNPHLTYTTPSVAPALRSESIGDPRGIAWRADGSKAYVTGMGSNNVIAIGPTGARLAGAPIPVGEGPTGIVVDELRNKVYVLNKFEASISSIDPVTNKEVGRASFFDPTPLVIKAGRPHLYNTHTGSGTGHISCASCHLDGRWDRLAWDLGDPSGAMDTVGGKVFHPLKGLKTTQFLIDIIGKGTGALHWRGDKSGFESFAGAFQHLQGADAPLDATGMQEFSDFLAACWYVPNPYRTYRPESTVAAATERMNPNRVRFTGTSFQTIPSAGVRLFVSVQVNCSHCHNAQTGRGERAGNGNVAGNGGSVDFSDNQNMASDLRAVYRKNGFFYNTTECTSGFGLMSDGVFETRFNQSGTGQYLGDYEPELLSWSGGITAANSPSSFNFPLVHTSQDAMPAVGLRETINGSTVGSSSEVTFMKTLVNDFPNDYGLIVKGIYQGEKRGFYYLGSDNYQSDMAGQTVTHAQLIADAQAAGPLSWTIVQKNTTIRMGVDADSDGILDKDDQLAMLNARVFLEGPFDGTSMRTDLLELGLLPSTDPYGTGAQAAPGVLARTGPTAPVDWVLVELRDPNNSTTVVATRAVFVASNGMLMTPSGEQTIPFPSVAAGNYHVAVIHRNHLGAMTASSVAVSGPQAFVDLTLASTVTYGVDARKNENGTMVLWAGNSTGDLSVKYTGASNDRDPILALIGGQVPTSTVPGYHDEDLDMDGVVKYTGAGNDRDVVLQTIGGTVPTSSRVEQIP